MRSGDRAYETRNQTASESSLDDCEMVDDFGGRPPIRVDANAALLGRYSFVRRV